MKILRVSNFILQFVSSQDFESKGLKFGTDIKSTNLKRSNHSDFGIRLLYVFVKWAKIRFFADDVIQSNLQ